MSLRWADERYVRVYTRDTPEWLSMSFLAQGLFVLLLRKVDRAGILPLGRLGKKGAAIAIGHAHEWNRLEAALEELLDDGCIVIQGDRLVVPNFIEAQEAPASNKLRQAEFRARARTKALDAPEGDNSSRYVTERNGANENELDRDETAREVTAGTARHGTARIGTVQHGGNGTTSNDAVGTTEPLVASASVSPPRLAALPSRNPGED